MVPFVYLSSVCWSLQCPISALTHAGGGGLLFRFACLVVLQGGRDAADTCHWPVCGALSVFWPHWVCPCLAVCFPRLPCSGTRLLYKGRALGSVRLRFSGTPQKRRLSWACVLCLPHPSSQAARSLMSALSPGAARLIPSVVPASVSACTSVGCTLCLFWGAGL